MRTLNPIARAVGFGLLLVVGSAFVGCTKDDHPARPERGTPTPGTGYDRNPAGTGTPASSTDEAGTGVIGPNTGSGPAPEADPRGGGTRLDEGAAGAQDSRGAAVPDITTPDESASLVGRSPDGPDAAEPEPEPDPADEPADDPAVVLPEPAGEPEPDDPSSSS